MTLQIVCRLCGSVSAKALHAALVRAVSRHDILRSAEESLTWICEPSSDGEYRLTVSAPMEIVDYRALHDLVREAVQLYCSDGNLKPVVQYADYVSWLRELEAADRQLADEGARYWSRRLQGASSARMAFALREASPARRPFSTVKAHVPRAVATRDCLLGAWGVLLHKMCGTQTIRVHVTVDGRESGDEASAVGCYAFELPVDLDVDLRRSFAALCRSIEPELAEASLWKSYYKPAADAAPARFGFTFTQQPRSIQVHGLTVSFIEQSRTVSGCELMLDCWSGEDGATATLLFDPGVYEPEDMAILAGRLEKLCAEVAENAGASPIQALSVLLPEDEAASSTRRELGPAICLHDALAAQVRKAPEHPAVVHGDASLSYSDLDARASAVAGRLVALGVGPDDRVAIETERSVDLITAIYGVWKAGGAYVPVDLRSAATERLQETLEESGCVALVSRGTKVSPLSVPNPKRSSAAVENLAYVLYTSGSTGRPNGVMITHAAVWNLWRTLEETVYSAARSGPLRVALNAPISFDSSVKQIACLLAGHTLHIVPEQVRRDPNAFVRWINDSRIEVLDCTPSHLGTLMEAGLLQGPSSLKIVLIGGEAIHDALWDELASCSAIKFFNVYGPTECTVDSTVARIDGGCRPNIGKPLHNVQTYVLDASQRPVPRGVIGELYIGGDGLARGYCGRPDLTAERFFPDTRSGGEGRRLYRTGDQVWRQRDDSLVFVGRNDRQLKVSGVRVDLATIETRLRRCEGVAWTHVAPVTRNETTQLAAWLVLSEAACTTVETIRQELSSRLAEQEIPAFFRVLESVPLTRNGKADLAALPSIEAGSDPSAQSPERPMTATEAAVFGIWSEVLDRRSIGLQENFFRIGGHSLLAMRVIALVRRKLGSDIPLYRLFQSPTIEGLAEAIEVHRCETRDDEDTDGFQTIPAIPR